MKKGAKTKTTAKPAKAKAAAAKPAKKPAAKAPAKKAVVKKTPAKPAVKKPAAKAPVKKAPAKKASPVKKKDVKKTEVKKVAVKKTETKKPEVKKVAVKKTEAQKPAAPVKPAPVKTPVKTIAKPVVKAPVKPTPVIVPRKKVATTNVTILPPDYDLKKDKGDFMNPVMAEYFRQKLIRWREELLRESTETIQVTLQGTELQKPDLADRASAETDHALELRTRDRERKLISKINEALLRIEDGTYGYCEETGEPITVARLDARPIATLSIEAQERHERLEKTHRDE